MNNVYCKGVFVTPFPMHYVIAFSVGYGIIVGDVDGSGSGVGVGHGFFGSSGKHGVVSGVAVGKIVGDAVGVGVCPVDSSAEEKFVAIPAALSKSEAPMIA